MILGLTQELLKSKIIVGAAEHGGSILDSHPPASGLNLEGPKVGA